MATEPNWRHVPLYCLAFFIPLLGQVALLIYVLISIPSGHRLPQRCVECKTPLGWDSPEEVQRHFEAAHPAYILAEDYAYGRVESDEMLRIASAIAERDFYEDIGGYRVITCRANGHVHALGTDPEAFPEPDTWRPQKPPDAPRKVMSG